MAVWHYTPLNQTLMQQLIHFIRNFCLLAIVIIMTNCSTNTDQPKTATPSMNDQLTISPPVAKKVAKELSIHDDTRIDNYYWMNDREDPESVV